MSTMADVWAACDQLTRPTYAELRRDDGSLEIQWLPSLWDQVTEAIHGGSSKTGGNVARKDEKSVVDLDLVEMRSIILRTINRELSQRGLRPRTDPKARDALRPAALRQLCSEVTREADMLWWWEYRFESWARALREYLRATEHQPRSVRLRNTSCPECGESSALIETEHGYARLPTIIVEFDGPIIRSARCDFCEATWPRGAGLLKLAEHARGYSIPELDCDCHCHAGDAAVCSDPEHCTHREDISA